MKKLFKFCVFLFFAFVLTVFMFGGSFTVHQRDSSEALVLSPILVKDLAIDVNKEGYGLGHLSTGVYKDEKVYNLMIEGNIVGGGDKL